MTHKRARRLNSARTIALERAAMQPERIAMSFGLYSLGFVIVIFGLIYGAHLAHVPAHWIAAGAIVLAGIGILSAVKATRQKDSSQ